MLVGNFGIGETVPDGFSIVLEAATLHNLDFASREPEVLLIGGGFSPPDLEQVVRRRAGSLAVLVLTDDPMLSRRLSNLPLSGWGVLLADVSPEELQSALQAVSQGLWVGAPELLRASLPRLAAGGLAEPPLPVEALTEREGQVLQCMARGLANKQIAAELGISDHTVKFHLTSIYSKLGATNRAQAVRIGAQHGLIAI
jgi:DNA-binding NarL/FixJ family response regulator